MAMNEAIKTLKKIGVDIWVSNVSLTQLNCIEKEQYDKEKCDKETLSHTERVVHKPVGEWALHYQAQQSSVLVLCDGEAMKVWHDVRKLLANILYFIDLKPGQYHIVCPMLDKHTEKDAFDLEKIAQLRVNVVLNFKSNCEWLEDIVEIRYVELPSLARMLKEPVLKQQVLGELTRFKHND